MEETFSLTERCIRLPIDEIGTISEGFACGNEDLDDFFHNDAPLYAKELLGKTYVMVLADNPNKIVCAFTVSNDSVKMALVPDNKLRNRMQRGIPNQKRMRSYPAVLIGRLGVSMDFKGLHIGSQLLTYIMMWFINRDNKTGCRFLVVDAYNDSAVLSFYLKNGFRFFYDSEEQEREAFHICIDAPLRQRLMIFDLMAMVRQTTAL